MKDFIKIPIFSLFSHNPSSIVNVNIQNNNGETALTLAAMQNNIDIVTTLLEVDNIDVTIKNNSSITAKDLGCILIRNLIEE